MVARETTVRFPSDSGSLQEDHGDEEAESVAEGSVADLEKMTGAEKVLKARKKQQAENRTGGYVVVYARAGRGTLHHLADGACWMAKKRSFLHAEVCEEMPDPVHYSTWCKLCWPPKGEAGQESTSDSVDGIDLTDGGDM